MIPMFHRKIKEREQRLAIRRQAFDRLGAFRPVFLKTSIAVSAAARLGESQTSRRSFFMLGCTERATLFDTFAVLCTQHL